MAYHVLRDRRPYSQLGGGHFDGLRAECLKRYHVTRLRKLGYDVTVAEPEVA